MAHPDYELSGGQRFPVVLNDGTPQGRQAVVIISGRESQTVTLETSSMRETHSFEMLVSDSRRGQVREWVKQIPVLLDRIAQVFAREKANGINPHLRLQVDDYGIRREDLLSGTSLYLAFAEMRLWLREGRKLPQWCDCPEVRAKLNLG
jgi:hypothetical protein